MRGQAQSHAPRKPSDPIVFPHSWSDHEVRCVMVWTGLVLCHVLVPMKLLTYAGVKSKCMCLLNRCW